MRAALVRTVLALCAVTPAMAQPRAVPTIVLDKGATEFPKPAVASSMVIELRDGRVLAASARTHKIDLLDFMNGSATTVASEGDGPMDIRFPGYFMFGIVDGAVFHSTPLPAMSPPDRNAPPVPMPPRPSGRLLYFSDGGVPLRQDLDDSTLTRGMLPATGIDSLGRLYTRANGILPLQPANPCLMTADSVAVYRIDRARGRADIVTQVPRQAAMMPSLRTTCSVDANGIPTRSMTYAPREFRANDVFTVLADGRLAMLRNGDFRIRFVGGASGETLGPPIPYVPVPVTEQDRAAAMDSARARRDAIAGRSGLTPIDVVESAPPPANKPPYEFIQLALDGRLLVGVPMAASDNGKRFELLDATGALIAHVQLAPGESFAGLGRGTIYTVRGLGDQQFLRRYSLKF